MSAELSLTLTATYSKSGISFTKDFSGTFTVTGSYPIDNVASIGTVDETLALGDVGGTPGWFCQEQGRDQLHHSRRRRHQFLQQAQTGRRHGGALERGSYSRKANTAACDLEYLLLPD
jgi:hypothetical protein